MPRSEQTEKRVSMGMRRLMRRLQPIYQRAFPYVGAPVEFWDYVTKVEKRLAAELSGEPSKVEISAWTDMAFDSIRKKIRFYAKQIEQPQFQEQIRIEDGKSRMIPRVPDFDEEFEVIYGEEIPYQ